jgi:hypothetical protein
VLDPNSAFSIAGLGAMLGWAGLLVSLFVPSARPIAWRAATFIIPALIAVAYVLLLGQAMQQDAKGGFGSIAEVRSLFANDSALAAGWIHYLAFDLFIGSWIVRDGVERRVPRLLIVPCLPLTFLAGPAGLLLYFALRLAFARRTKPEVSV